MRFKVGKQWFRCAKGQPLMVQFTPEDRTNIDNMVEGATRYATFDDDDKMTKEQMLEWMQEPEADTSRLAELSEQASGGPWELRVLPMPAHMNADEEAVKEWEAEKCFVQAPRNDPSHPYDIEVMAEDRHDVLYPPKQARADCELVVALVNAYRAGRLIEVPE